MKFFYIFIGGGIGAFSRYIMSLSISNFFNKMFPYGTLAVNILGCFIIGFLYALFEKFSVSPNIRLFLFVGVLGGFTTFSSFGLETFTLLRNSELKSALLNFFLSNFLCLIFVYFGFTLTKIIFKD